MMDWWPTIGEPSLIIGSSLGLVWSLISTTRRRRLYLRTATPPSGQFAWFLLSFFSMTCFVALQTALGLASLHDLIPQTLFWFLLGLSAIAFLAALMFQAMRPTTPADTHRRYDEPSEDPPVETVRQTA